MLVLAALANGRLVPAQESPGDTGPSVTAGNRATGHWQRIGPDGAAVREVIMAGAGYPAWLVGAERQAAESAPQVYRSDDRGLTWIAASGAGEGALPAGWITDLAADPTDPQRVWAVMEAGTARVVRSEDGGAHWSVVPVPADAGAYQILIAASGRVFVYGGTLLRYEPSQGTWVEVFGHTRTAAVAADGSLWALPWVGMRLHRSTDAGATWRQVNPAELHCGYWLTADPQRPERLFTEACNGQLLRSDDYGATFEAIGPLNDYGHGLVDGPVRVNPENSDELWAYASALYHEESGLLHSLDGGVSWEPWGRSLPLAGLGQQVSLAVDPADPTHILVGSSIEGGAGVFVTEDAGASWAEGRGLQAMVVDLAIDAASPDRLLAVVGGGLFERAGVGQPWRRSALQGTPGPRTTARTVVADGIQSGLWWVNGGSGLHRTADGGVTWERVGEAQWQGIAVDPGHAGRLYSLTYQGRPRSLLALARSTDAGTTFAATRLSLEWLRGLAANASDRSSLLLVGDRCIGLNRYGDECDGSRPIVAASADSGRHWEEIAVPARGAAVVFLPAAEGAAGAAVVATNRGLYRRAAAGEPWQRVAPRPHLDLVAGARALYALRKEPDGAVTVVGSDPTGTHWRPIGGPLPYRPHALRVSAGRPDVLYALTAGGVYQLVLRVASSAVRRLEPTVTGQPNTAQRGRSGQWPR